MSIKDWPALERPREKLLQLGAAALSEAELLAIVIRSGRRGVSAVELARELLQRFGSLSALLATGATPPMRCPGLTPARYAQLQAALELARRHYLTPLRSGVGLDGPRASREFLTARLRDLPYEVFCCLFLDARNRLISFEELFRGGVTGAFVHAGEVVKRALAHNAVAVVAVHNHPSGVAEPSQCDELLTRRLREALRLVDIELIDHLVVGDGECVSFAERGLL